VGALAARDGEAVDVRRGLRSREGQRVERSVRAAQAAGPGHGEIPDEVLVDSSAVGARADVDRRWRSDDRDGLGAGRLRKELDVEPEGPIRADLDRRPAEGAIGLLLEPEGVGPRWQLRDPVRTRRI